jgi:hypothetical protein
MKIQLSELKRIIREVLEEEAGVPGKFFPYSGNPVTGEEVHSMDKGGLGQKKSARKRMKFSKKTKQTKR